MNLIISFTNEGETLGNKVQSLIGGKHIIKSKSDIDIRQLIGNKWRELNSIIFISSTGIAVRFIKDYIVSKDVDPAIVVIDDMGKNVISLLSGHLGGANEITEFLGEKLNANPVITTATDNRGIESVDIYSRKHNLEIENIQDIKLISMKMLQGEKIGFYSDINLPTIGYENIVKLESLEKLEEIQGLIIITNKKIKDISIPNIVLRPKNLVVGIGCRKGMEGKKITDAIKSELEKLELSHLSLYKFGTVEAKKDEAGIFESGKNFNCEVKIFTNEEIKKVENLFEKSQFVKDTIGVYSVSEPSCYLLGGKIMRGKQKYNGITVSIGEID